MCLLAGVGAAVLAGATSAHAQAGSTLMGGRSLGGFGAMTPPTASGMPVMNGPAIPYAGRFGGFMPYRMAGSSPLAFTARGESAAVAAGRTPFNLSSSSARMDMGSGVRGITLPGATGGMSTMSGGMGRPGVMPPSFAYPFRQPPSLLPGATSTVGMSM